MAKTHRHFGDTGLYHDLGLSGGKCSAMDRIIACFSTNYHLFILRNYLDFPIKTNVILDGTWPLAKKTAQRIDRRMFS